MWVGGGGVDLGRVIHFSFLRGDFIMFGEHPSFFK